MILQSGTHSSILNRNGSHNMTSMEVKLALSENLTERPLLRNFLHPLNREELDVGDRHPLGLQQQIPQVLIPPAAVGVNSALPFKMDAEPPGSVSEGFGGAKKRMKAGRLPSLPHSDAYNRSEFPRCRPVRKDGKPLFGFGASPNGQEPRRWDISGRSRWRRVPHSAVVGRWTTSFLPARRPHKRLAGGHPGASRRQVGSEWGDQAV